MSELLTVSNLNVVFGGLHALTSFDMSVSEGEFHGIIGPNGAGKTTAINVLTGFLPRRDGQIIFEGRPLARSPHRIATSGIGRTFQSPALFPGLTAVENVMTGGYRWTQSGLMGAIFGSRLTRREEGELRALARELLISVGYSQEVDAPAHSISFGDLRKVEIARALMGKPRLLVLDEPTAGLTPDEVANVGKLLRSYRTAEGNPLTVILIEHNVPFVFSLCDRVTAVDKGKIIAVGAPAEVRATPAVIASYLGGSQPGDQQTARAPIPTREQGEVILELGGVSAGYGQMRVIREIDLTLRAGELSVLCGRNGAGKSTLLNATTGFPKITAGTVKWLGKRIERLSVSSIVRRGIGLVPQERGIIGGQTVDANLELSAIGLRLKRTEYQARHAALMRRFPKLAERSTQLAGTLSGGERQMLALAKVLMRQPRLMLLDEPTIGLAPTIVEELKEIIVQVNREGVALCIAEQNVGWVAPVASKAYLLEGGEIISSGSPSEIIREEQIIESYLGSSSEAASAAS